MISAYGWTDWFQRCFDALPDAAGLAPGRVIEQQRALYRVVTDGGELSAHISGRFAFDAAPGDYPVAGDWVALAARLDEGAGTIQHVLPRRTAFQRRAPLTGALQIVAANLDVALLVTSLNGDLNPRRIERYLAAARESGAEPVIVLTKADACSDGEARRAAIGTIAGGAAIHVVSALTGAGMDDLSAHLKPCQTAALLGSSGVGKSTLVNALAGEAVMETSAISGDDKRGRHTTTHRELILLPSGALLLDSPGMRELGLWDAEEGVVATFEDVEALIGACRFSDCQHRREPGCAVRKALESGALDEGRWGAYNKLQRELAFEARKEDPALRAQATKRWAKVHKNTRARMKFRGKY
jgi:ribosome biogenesis GTPase